MSDKDEDKLLDHDYDGIQEYDNDLPKWWVNLFYITIIYSIIYVGYRHFSSAKNDYEVLKDEITAVEAIKAANKAKEPVAVTGVAEEKRILALVANSEVVAAGKALYDGKCMSCHGDKGQGIVGPNLTDKHWIYGGKPTEIRNVIEVGVPEKGMLAWKESIDARGIESLVVYILTMDGTKPANAKKAEGVIYNGLTE